MFNKDDVMRIDFSEKYGEIEIPMVALFNKNVILEEEAVKAIKIHGDRSNNKVIIITKEQFDNVF